HLLSPSLPTSLLFPYTTLFRSNCNGGFDVKYGVFCRWLFSFWGEINNPTARGITTNPFTHALKSRTVQISSRCNKADHTICGIRSEEHTSELQSRFDLVCRLLL